MSPEEIQDQLQQFWLHRQGQVQSEFNRNLPFGELVVDRWERARRLGFEEGVSIYDSALVFGDVRVGRKTWIGPFTILDGSGGLTIGEYCSISAGVQIYTHDSVQWALSGGQASYDHASVRIGSNSYLGPSTVIAKGVTIGSRCVIGAHSLVLHDVPDGCKAFGTPCRTVGHADVSSPPAQSAD